MFQLPKSIPPRRARGMAWFLTVCFILALSLAFWFYENWSIASETVTVSDARLPAEFSGFRIVELADLHGREFGHDNTVLLQAVQALAPDLIAIDGDLIDERTDLSMLAPLLDGLCRIAPVYYVTGNHEWARRDTQDVLQLLEAHGVTVLANDYRVLRRGDAKLIVAGVHDPNGPADQKTPAALVAEIRAQEGSDAYILMLSHRNDRISMWAALGVPLVLAGHCHGGVVRLPFLGGIFGSGRTFLPKYSAGLYRQDATFLFVSRGLGNTRAILRLFNRPHLPVILLRKP